MIGWFRNIDVDIGELKDLYFRESLLALIPNDLSHHSKYEPFTNMKCSLFPLLSHVSNTFSQYLTPPFFLKKDLAINIVLPSFWQLISFSSFLF